MSTHRNNSSHFEVRFSDGQVMVESVRNSVGGWANFVRRVEQATGERVRPTDETGRVWQVGERTATVTRVWKQ